MNAKKISALLLAAVMAIPCAAPSQVLAAEAVVEEAQAAETKTPKYIFLFIGDGMSYPQIQTTNYYLNAIEDDGDDILTLSLIHIWIVFCKRYSSKNNGSNTVPEKVYDNWSY